MVMTAINVKKVRQGPTTLVRLHISVFRTCSVRNSFKGIEVYGDKQTKKGRKEKRKNFKEENKGTGGEIKQITSVL